MRLLVFLCPLQFACITDDGKIDSSCDEVPQPCVWEDGEDTDSGGDGDSGLAD